MIKSREDLEKPVVKDLDSFVPGTRIPQANTHSIAMENPIKPVLAITVSAFAGIENLI